MRGQSGRESSDQDMQQVTAFRPFGLEEKTEEEMRAETRLLKACLRERCHKGLEYKTFSSCSALR